MPQDLDCILGMESGSPAPSALLCAATPVFALPEQLSRRFLDILLLAAAPGPLSRASKGNSAPEAVAVAAK